MQKACPDSGRAFCFNFPTVFVACFMLFSLRQQVYYSFLGLLLFAAFPWLLFVIYGPGAIKALGEIYFFEAGSKMQFPVNYLSSEIFSAIRFGYPALVLVFSAFSLAFFKAEIRQLPALIRLYFSGALRFLRQELTNMSAMEKFLAGLTFLLIIVERGYYLFRYPVHTDEAASFFLFIQHGPFAITSFYPVPNNHLLQNLLAWPLTLLFREPFWVLRLPPLFFSLVLSFSGFLILKRFSGFLISYLAIALFSFGSLTLFLSTQGRGYVLLTLLAVMAMTLLFQALRTGRTGYWVALTLTAALGFFTVPTFAYPFAVSMAFGGLYLVFRQRRQQLPKLFCSAIFTIAIVAILYAPLLLISGKDALFNNRYLQPLTPEQFSQWFLNFLVEVQGLLAGGKFGYGIRVFLLSLPVLVLLFIFQNRPFIKKLMPRQANWLAGYVLLSNLVIYALLRFQLMHPPARVLYFKSFFDFLGIAIAVSVLLNLILRKPKWRLYIAFAGTLIFAGFQISAAEAFLKDYPRSYYNLSPLVQQIQQSNAKCVYIEEPFYQLFLNYEYARFGRKIRIENELRNLQPPFDYVVIEHYRPFPAGLSQELYELVYQDEVVKAYLLKSSW